ncbi:MAG TPA: FtsX-like permease family protein [Thermoanaerobaculia bacterium]|nr:FtsX-like permease family protein [Thermoanaerobaculia bacterium]
MRRSLRHYWRGHLAVALGAAVATAVLAGALVVGDSVRGSLAALASERLGRIDYVLAGPRLFRAALADELTSEAGLGVDVAPALVVRGTAGRPDRGTRASGVTVWGIDGRLARLYPGEPRLTFPPRQGSLFPPVLLSESLARELSAAAGDSVLLSFESLSEIPKETLIGRADAERATRSLRLTVAAVLPDRGPGGLRLDAGQSAAANAFVELPRLARALELAGRANALLVAAGGHDVAGTLEAALARRLTVGDLGLEVSIDRGTVVVESRELVLPERAAAGVRVLAQETGAAVSPVLTYLANRLEVGGRWIPYSTVAALDPPAADAADRLVLVDGAPAPPLGEGEIYLNEWAAEDLAATPGQELELTYFSLGPRDELATATARFRVKGVVAMAGLGANGTLTPEMPGLSDAESMSAWEPPFPVDLGLIRDRDEDYWDAYRAAPKSFVGLAAGQALWRNRFGELTSLRLTPSPEVDAAALAARLESELPRRLAPGAQGLSFQAVSALAAQGARGATDFGQLFLAFSFFLIVAAALLTGLLFRLVVEGRAREVGLLGALGFPAARVKRRFLAEGLAVAGLGVAAGLAGAVGYARLLLLALATVWRPAVGTSELHLHVQPLSLVVGGAIALVMVYLAIRGAVASLLRREPARLLAGEIAAAGPAGRARASRWLALVLGLAGLGLAAAMLGSGRGSSPALAFGAGACLLGAGLAALAAWARGGGRRIADRLSRAGVLRLGAQASRRSPGRSLLAAALVASASFVLVTVGAQRGGRHFDVADRASGAGGFPLIAESSVPLLQDLNRPEGRRELGLDEEAAAALDGTRVYPLRLVPGDDASCLNLYRPQKPRVLGLPPELIERGGFSFQASARSLDNPWRLLEEDLGPNVVPAVLDANSATWILKVGLGDDVVLDDEAGKPLRLRVVGLLAKSIFQSEVLISEAALLRHFPSRAGYSAFLIEAPPERAPTLTEALERSLAGFGFDAEATADRLAAFEQVEQTYLSTFQSLGGLGLLLGTVGLGVILLRNALERRKELAALRALGFPVRRLQGLLLAENAFLLAVGLGLGTAAALLAVAPHLREQAATVPWPALTATLALVFATGLAASGLVLRGALPEDLVGTLKGE